MDASAASLSSSSPTHTHASSPTHASPPQTPPMGVSAAKFLIGRDGEVLSRYPPQASPESIVGDIEAALKAPIAQCA
jgi:hypothetical protein